MDGQINRWIDRWTDDGWIDGSIRYILQIHQINLKAQKNGCDQVSLGVDWNRFDNIHRGLLQRVGFYTVTPRHRRFHTQAPLHTEAFDAFIRRSLYMRSFCTRAFTQGSVCTEKPLHRAVFTRSSRCTQKIPHRNLYTGIPRAIFADISLQAEKPLGREAFRQRSLHTQTLLHTRALTRRHLYRQKRFHTEVFTHRLLNTEKPSIWVQQDPPL